MLFASAIGSIEFGLNGAAIASEISESKFELLLGCRAATNFSTNSSDALNTRIEIDSKVSEFSEFSINSGNAKKSGKGRNAGNKRNAGYETNSTHSIDAKVAIIAITANQTIAEATAESKTGSTAASNAASNAGSIAGSNAGSTAASKTSYLLDTLEYGLYRWAITRSPLNVYLGDPSLIGLDAAQCKLCKDQLALALSDWLDNLDGLIEWQSCTDLNSADIIAEWNLMISPEIRPVPGKTELIQSRNTAGKSIWEEPFGSASIQRTQEGIAKSEIKIFVNDATSGEMLSAADIYRICLHEVGHALGIVRHSPNNRDIMFPALSKQFELSQRDRETLKSLYDDRFLSELINVEFRRTISQKSESIEKSPTTGNNKFLIDWFLLEGTNACQKKNFRHAVQNLEKLMLLQPENIIARRNLAVSYNGLALENANSANSADSTNSSNLLNLLFRAVYWFPDEPAINANLSMAMESCALKHTERTAKRDLAVRLEQEGEFYGAAVMWRMVMTNESNSDKKKIATMNYRRASDKVYSDLLNQHSSM